jgi:ketosteroid isomerase-like protein
MMPHSAVVAACKLAFTGFEKNDRSGFLRLLATDFVFDVPDSLPYGGTYYGQEEFLAFWQQLVAKEWQYFHYDCEVVLQDGDYVVVPVVTRALSLNGILMENEHVFLFKTRDEKITYGRLYIDTARARDVLEGRKPTRYPKQPLSLGTK